VRVQQTRKYLRASIRFPPTPNRPIHVVARTPSLLSPTCCGNRSIAAWRATKISTTRRGFPRTRLCG
jgi:hypothetical protein